MSEELQKYVIPKAEVMYPRIDRTYAWSDAANTSVPCKATDDNAEYSLSFKIPKSEAGKLMKQMKAYYDESKKKGWPDKFPIPFKEQDDGLFLGRAKLAGAYNGEPTRKPPQYDSQNKTLDDDFKLTSGSIANIAVTFVPYSISKSQTGVSLRLNGVQVIKYVPMKTASPFEAVADGFVSDSTNPFESFDNESEAVSDAADDEEDPFAEIEEPVEEPKKKAVKKSTAAPKEDSDDLSSLIEKWDDDED